MDYKRIENKVHFIPYRDAQIQKLSKLICDWTDLNEKYKNAAMLAYWFKDYEGYLRSEDTFKTQSKYLRYKRGQILKINFGYRIGHELGGQHYAVVINKNDTVSSGNVTVVPFKSWKPKRLHFTELDLQDGFRISVLNKVEKEVDTTLEKISLINAVDQGLIYTIEKLEEVLEQGKRLFALPDTFDIGYVEIMKEEFKHDSVMLDLWKSFETNFEQNNIKELLTNIKEIMDLNKSRRLSLNATTGKFLNRKATIQKMKQGTIADVSQITTISKMRIMDPIRNSDMLTGILLEQEYMELINQKIKEVFIY